MGNRAMGGCGLTKFLLLGTTILLYSASLGQAQIPSTLGWFDVSGQQLKNVCPPDNFGGQNYLFSFYCQNVIKGWSSGITDTKRNRLLIWGGGHNDYYGNELYSFDLNALTLTRLNSPSPIASGTGCPTTLSDGNPNSRHTYGGLTYITHADKMYVFGGAPANIDGCVSLDTWTLDLSTMKWTRLDPTNGSGPASNESLLGAVAAYDPNTQLVFLNGRNCFYSYSVDTNAYNKLQCSGDLTLGTTAVVDPKRQLFFTFGNGAIRKINIAAGSTYSVSNPAGVGCSALTNSASPGLVYDSILDRIVGWPDFGNTVYLYNPDTDSCTTQTFSGGPPDSAHQGPAPSSAGTFGRFAYFPSLGVYAVVNDWDIDAHTLRLTNGAPPPPDTTPPTVSITAPSNGSTVSGTIAISATASDNVGVVGVQFKVDGANTGAELLSAPYNYNLDTTALSNGGHTVTAAARDAAGNATTSAGVSITVNNTAPPSPSGGSDFQSRCSDPNVVRCFTFDSMSMMPLGSDSDSFTSIQTNENGQYEAALDTVTKADGAGSLRFTVPSNTGANTSGALHMNFKDDNSVQFGPGQEFYVQYRVRYNDVMINTNFTNSNGFKVSIIGEGDMPGYVAPSCTDIHTVIENSNQAGYPQMYHSCGAKDNSYQALESFIPNIDDYFDQDGSLSAPHTACFHYGGRGNPPDVRSCFNFAANEWITFQQHVKVGTWYVNNSGVYHRDSTVELWAAHQGQPSQLIISYNDYDLAGPADHPGAQYGKIWLLPYQTNKSSLQTTATGYVWYDDLIVSRRRIPDPDISVPNAPDTLRAQPGSGSIKVTWRSNSANEQGFKVERCAGSDSDCWSGYQSFSQVAALPAGSNTYTDTAVAAGTTYTYRVYAYNASGNSAMAGGACWAPANPCYGSASSSVSGTPDTTPPSVPTGLMAVAISSNSIMANWSASTDNVGVTGYKVFRCQGAGCTPSVQVAAPTANSFQDTGLTASTTYTYTVSAFDAAGNVSALSASASAVTLSSSSVSSNLPPIVSAIGTNATDVDPATPGLQIYDNTSVTYTGTASDPNGGTIAWQWLYSTNGGAPVLMASGTGTVQPFTFNYPAGIAPKTYVWILSANNGVSTAQQTLTVNVIARPSSPPPPPPADPTPGLKKALVYPNPVVKADPTIRAMVGMVDSVEVTIFDVSGHVVNSGSVSGAPTGILNGQYYYDYKWTGSKASGGYVAVVHGKAADGTIVRARVKFIVVN